MGIISWFLSDREPEEPGWLRLVAIPRGGGYDPKLDAIKQDAEADVDEMEEEDHRYFRRDGPGHREDALQADQARVTSSARLTTRAFATCGRRPAGMT